MLSYRIRPASAEDVGFLADVVIEATRAQGRLPGDFDERQWRSGFADWTMQQLRGEIPDSTTSVVEVGDERAGRLRITRTADCIELSGIQLLPGVQRRGIGTAIIEDLKAQAAAVGIPLDLGVEKDNPQARKLYERLGFRQVGETEQECKLRWSPRPDVMPARLALPPLPTLHGESVTLRARRDSDIDDRVREPIDPEEEDAYTSSWRREWDGRRYHARADVAGRFLADEPDAYTWAVEYGGHCIGGAGLRVNRDQHRAAFWIGLFVADLRGRGLGRQVTRLILDWAFSDLGAHRVELEVLATNHRAIRCYLACGFRQEGVRREAELYPDGWHDFIEMAVLASEYAPAP